MACANCLGIFSSLKQECDRRGTEACSACKQAGKFCLPKKSSMRARHKIDDGPGRQLNFIMNEKKNLKNVEKSVLRCSEEQEKELSALLDTQHVPPSDLMSAINDFCVGKLVDMDASCLTFLSFIVQEWLDEINGVPYIANSVCVDDILAIVPLTRNKPDTRVRKRAEKRKECEVCKTLQLTKRSKLANGNSREYINICGTCRWCGRCDDYVTNCSHRR